MTILLHQGYFERMYTLYQDRRLLIDKNLNLSFVHSLCLRVVLGPESHELVQMVRPQNGPIASEIVEVIHDDSHEQIDNLKVRMVGQ